MSEVKQLIHEALEYAKHAAELSVAGSPGSQYDVTKALQKSIGALAGAIMKCAPEYVTYEGPGPANPTSK